MIYNWVFDTPALIAHATGTSTRVRAGLRLLADEPVLRLRVPATCLLEAYAATPPNAHPLLDGLAVSPGVAVDPVSPDPRVAAVVGRLAGTTGRAGAAHAAYVAIEGDGPSLVFTDAPMPAEVLSRPF